MREILFRGKRIDNGEWVEGYYARKGADEESYRHCICVSWLNSGYQSNYQYPFYLVDYEVDPETVCQYTGLTDKNGKKIFEGDILLIRSAHHLFGDKNEDIGQVALHGVGDCWWAKSKHELSHYPYGYYLSVMCDKETYNTDYEVEIIGNVYDNPELMKGEQK